MTAVKLLVDGHAEGVENMRRDEALLAAGEPVVRFYGWRPAAVSLGRAQGPDVVDADAARAFGVDVVQRATGGGAILHNEQEVTYAVVLPLDWPGLPRDISGSFAYCSGGVVEALRTLGLEPEIQSDPEGTREILCYVRRQGTNVFVNGRKISGGAQRRTRTHLLQHGTVIVERDAERMARLLRAEPDGVRAKVTSLREEGVDVGREKLVEALAAGYAATLGAPLERA